jgi:hypothetical protein
LGGWLCKKIKNWGGSLLQGDVPGAPGITTNGRYSTIALGELDPPSLKLWRAGIFYFYWTFQIEGIGHPDAQHLSPVRSWLIR